MPPAHTTASAPFTTLENVILRAPHAFLQGRVKRLKQLLAAVYPGQVEDMDYFKSH